MHDTSLKICLKSRKRWILRACRVTHKEVMSLKSKYMWNYCAQNQLNVACQNAEIKPSHPGGPSFYTLTNETYYYHPFSCLHQNSHISISTLPSQPFLENS